MNVLQITVNGKTIDVDEPQGSLLDTLRYQLSLKSVKDGCSPQGQCGCCTVLVDGQARVSCVTPVRRVRGRSVVTVEGLDDDRRAAWADRFCDTGASQCGFCTPGIVMRLEGLAQSSDEQADSAGESMSSTIPALGRHEVEQGLLAHLCRCTGWQTIVEAACGPGTAVELRSSGDSRDLRGAARRAVLEGRTPQVVSSEVPVGRGGFAADTAPPGCLVAVTDSGGQWVVGESLYDARRQAAKVQGRRTTVAPSWPIDVPDGQWAAALQTTWVDGAYLETDASWCEPDGTPASVEANGGAFGAKRSEAADISAAARRLADQHGRAVLALASREDVTRFGLKRPPVAGGIADDGTATLTVARTPGIADAIAAGVAANPHLAEGVTLTVTEVDVPGPPTSVSARAAGWAEAVVLLSAANSGNGPVTVRSPEGAEARVSVEPVAATGTEDASHRIHVSVSCGPVLDPVVLRSYCIGAAHMAWSWLTSESLAVDADGQVHDLTVRSFGVLRAVDSPTVVVELIEDADESGREAVNGSDAVFAAVAAAGWQAYGFAQTWPVGL